MTARGLCRAGFTPKRSLVRTSIAHEESPSQQHIAAITEHHAGKYSSKKVQQWLAIQITSCGARHSCPAAPAGRSPCAGSARSRLCRRLLRRLLVVLPGLDDALFIGEDGSLDPVAVTPCPCHPPTPPHRPARRILRNRVRGSAARDRSPARTRQRHLHPLAARFGCCTPPACTREGYRRLKIPLVRFKAVRERQAVAPILRPWACGRPTNRFAAV
jgi:hypothetical protein